METTGLVGVIAVIVPVVMMAITAMGMIIKVMREMRKERESNELTRNSLVLIQKEMQDINEQTHNSIMEVQKELKDLTVQANGSRWIKETEASLIGKVQGALAFMPADNNYRLFVDTAVCENIRFVINILKSVVEDINIEYIGLKYWDVENHIMASSVELLSEGLCSYIAIAHQCCRDDFIRNMSNIISDSQNAKRYRIRDSAEAFVTLYLSELSKAWYNYNNRGPTN